MRQQATFKPDVMPPGVDEISIWISANYREEPRSRNFPGLTYYTNFEVDEIECCYPDGTHKCYKGRDAEKIVDELEIDIPYDNNVVDVPHTISVIELECCGNCDKDK